MARARVHGHVSEFDTPLSFGILLQLKNELSHVKIGPRDQKRCVDGPFFMFLQHCAGCTAAGPGEWRGTLGHVFSPAKIPKFTLCQTSQTHQCTVGKNVRWWWTLLGRYCSVHRGHCSVTVDNAVSRCWFQPGHCSVNLDTVVSSVKLRISQNFE